MFAKYAEAYWAKGLSVLPLAPRQKAPIPQGWSNWCKTLPPEEVRQDWLSRYDGDENLGLALGSASGLVAIDLDTPNEIVRAVLEEVLPWSPWERVGAKGWVRLFKYSGERSFSLRDSDNNGLLDVLSENRQVVLPPSIHPATQLPYRANADLLEVVDQVLPLPPEFETLLRTKLIAAGVQLGTKGAIRVTDWVPAGARDSQMVRIAGFMALGVLRGERTLLEALDHVETWAESFTEKVAGDVMDPQRCRQKVFDFLRRDVMERGKLLPKGWDAGMSAEDVIKAREALGDVEDEWTLDDFLTFFSEEEVGRSDVKAAMDLINRVLTRVATNQGLSSVDIEVILKQLYEKIGKQVSIAVIRKQLKTMTAGEEAATGESHAEIANMLLEDLKQYGEVRFANGRLYQWMGSHFEAMEPHVVNNLLIGRYGNLPAGKRHSDHKGILRTLESLATKELKESEEKGINFANGFLTPDLQLLPHDPRFGCTYVLPYRYMVDHPMPVRFFTFLEQCWGTHPDYADKVQALREVIASLLFGYGPMCQRAVCLYGRAKTGKSVLSYILRGLCSEDAISYVPPQDWQDRFKPVSMAGKLLNFCGELSETKNIYGDKFKNVIDGEMQTGEYKGQQVFTFKPECLQLFCSNHLPKSPDNSNGFPRRWQFFTFTEVVPDDQVNGNLAQEILDEDREGIACWAVGAVTDVLRQSGYTQPSSQIEMLEQLMEALNSVRLFLRSREVVITKDLNDQVAERELFMRYYSFCRLQANKPGYDMSKFRAAFEELSKDFGLTGTATNRGYVYSGLKLVDVV